MKNKLIRAQFSLEYAVVIVCIIIALIAMQAYMKRGMQGKMRQTADSIGEQYDPASTTSDSTMAFNSVTNTLTTTIDNSGSTTTNTVSNFEETQTRTGTETVGPLENATLE
ncbi:MAG: hypothetical protein WC723_02875 [Candidatus Omnitrophota bacterium]